MEDKREIKLRAWLKEEKRMIDVYNWNKGDEIDYISVLKGFNGRVRYFIGDECELMQSTGLKDVTGAEIYEGDFIKTDMDNNPIVRVVWKSHRAAFGLYHTDYAWPLRAQKGEIIGNIYENPEHLR